MSDSMAEVTPIRRDVSISTDSAKFRFDEIRASVNGAQAVELDGIADVLHYLHNTQPIDGVDYQDDDALKDGHAEIMEWLERRVRAIGGRDTA
jgi:hypothetical protein